MLISEDHKKSLDSLFHLIRVRNINPGSGGAEKVGQILSYLEVIHSCVKKYMGKRDLVFIDSAAGNCYLSFLVYYYYANLCGRGITIHCVDTNNRLMENCSRLAGELGFGGMNFHSGDILHAPAIGNVDMTYSLHACDTATDKALGLGIKLNARCILSVACCQHSFRKGFRNKALKGITRYKALKDQLVYLVADAMRANLLGAEGYKTDIFEFTSTRNTDKNIMLRAVRTGNAHKTGELSAEYAELKKGFEFEPMLAGIIGTKGKK